MKTQIDRLKIPQLKQLLLDYEQPVNGTKAELILRLKTFLQSDEVEIGSNEDEVGNENAANNETVQKQLDKLKNMMKMLVGMMQNQNMSDRGRSAEVASVATALPNANTTTSTMQSPSVIDTVRSAEITLAETSTNNENVGVTSRMHTVKEIAETIPEFDHNDEASITVEKFVDRVNMANSVYNWDSRTLLLAVYSKLRGGARVWFDGADQFTSTWQELQQKMIDEFSSQLDETQIYEKMARSVQKQGEKLEEYFIRITALGKKMKLSDAAIIRHARNGLNNRELRYGIAALKFKTIHEMQTACIEFLTNAPSEKHKTPTQMLKKDKWSSDKLNNENSKTKSMNDVKCYNCEERGHIATKYPKPKKRRRCIDCHKMHPPEEPENCGKKVVNCRRVHVDDSSFVKPIEVDGMKMMAYIDTGSQCNLIKKEMANGLKAKRHRCSLIIQGLGGGVHKSNWKLNSLLKIDGVMVTIVLYVVEDFIIENDVLVGRDIFHSQPCIEMVYRDGELMFQMAYNPEQCETQSNIVCLSNSREIVEANPVDTNSSELNDFLLTNDDIFAHDIKQIGKTTLVTFKIELDTDVPIAQTPYRIPEPKRKEVARMIDELLYADIIQPSEAEYASPMILVKKKDGQDRWCIDYRRLNSHTRKEAFPTPNVEERLQDAKKFKIFSTLDLNSGFYQIPVENESRKYTTFVTPDGLYEFKRMPFGLRNAPMAFQRLMAKIKNMLHPDDMIHYMDDILVGSHTKDEMFEKLTRAFRVLREAGLTLNRKKCVFFQESITFLGHQLTADGIEPGKIKVAAINEYLTPTTLTEL